MPRPPRPRTRSWPSSAFPPATGEPRRVNVGVVNIGIIPATFRISARTRTGATIGRSVESGVPEDQVWLVNDIENELGVKLDETMTVRVTVIAGTGVALRDGRRVRRRLRVHRRDSGAAAMKTIDTPWDDRCW